MHAAVRVLPAPASGNGSATGEDRRFVVDERDRAGRCDTCHLRSERDRGTVGRRIRGALSVVPDADIGEPALPVLAMFASAASASRCRRRST